MKIGPAFSEITCPEIQPMKTRKLSSIEDRSPTDRVSTFDLDFRSLTLTSDLDVHSQESDGHDPYS